MNKEYSIEEMMNFIVDSRAVNLPANAISDVFDSLCWCFDDNGHAIKNVLQKWLLSDDRYRVDVSLNQKFVYFFDTVEEHTSIYTALLNKWPCLEEEINLKLNDIPPRENNNHLLFQSKYFPIIPR